MTKAWRIFHQAGFRIDEPTSALDPASERLVYEALLKATKYRTVIMVTHDEKVLALVDRVVTLVPYCADGESTGAAVELMS